MKKRLFAAVLAAMMVASLMATTVFAAEPEMGSTGEKKLYSMTLDIDPLANGSSSTAYASTVTLSMPGYSNDWSVNKPNVDFSRLASNAVVETVEIYPGKLSAGSSTTSPITTTKYALTSPSGHRLERTFKTTGETMAFYGESAKGMWTFQIYGTNVGRVCVCVCVWGGGRVSLPSLLPARTETREDA